MLIGLTGRAGGGKDTVCQLMREWGDTNGFSVRREAFADRLKLSFARIFFPDVDLESAVSWCNLVKAQGELAMLRVDSPTTIPGRSVLQRYGTEAHRDVFGTDFWVDAALADMSADITVVTDVRFANESDAIRGRDGEVWNVIRPGDPIEHSSHPSEAGLPRSHIDLDIVNDGSLDQLRVLVGKEMHELDLRAL